MVLLTILGLGSTILQNYSNKDRDLETGDLETGDPKTGDLMSWLTPGLPSVAPAKLLLDDLNYRLVNLENGDSIPIISGKIINDTGSSFSDIIIEGLAFDDLGRNIGRISSPLFGQMISVTWSVC